MAALLAVTTVRRRQTAERVRAAAGENVVALATRVEAGGPALYAAKTAELRGWHVWP